MYFSDSDGGTERGDGGTEHSCRDAEGGLGDTEGGCGDMKHTCLAVHVRSHSCAMRLGAVISTLLASIAGRWAMTRSSTLAEIAREGVPLTTPKSNLRVISRGCLALLWAPQYTGMPSVFFSNP